MAIQSYSWCYDTAKYQIFPWWPPHTYCKDFLFTQVENRCEQPSTPLPFDCSLLPSNSSKYIELIEITFNYF